jgi:hypothetical protein
MNLKFSRLMPFYSPDDLGGGMAGGGNDAPADTGGNLEAPAEPSVVDVSDDTLIRVKGSDKPVKYNEHIKGFQANFTKASQRAAQLERELQAREQRIQQYEREKAQQGRQSQSNDMLSAIRELPYLSGQDAAEVVQSIAQQLNQRDQVTMRALQEIKNLRDIVGGLRNESVSSQFESKISRWLTEGNYPAEAGDLAKEIYLAYEGDDLDQDFPRIFKERWEQINRIIDAQRAQKLSAARKTPFVPGRGGQSGPSKPLEVPANAAPKDVADLLWEAMGNTPNT